MRKSIIFLLAVGIISSVSFVGVRNAEASTITNNSVIRYVNEYRHKENLQSLKISPALTLAAQMKADDMARRNYFSHADPDGNKAWLLIQKQRYSYWIAGENLAMDYTSTSKVAKAWMGSPGHRANILNSQFTETGIGIAKVKINNWERIYVVQLFALPYLETK